MINKIKNWLDYQKRKKTNNIQQKKLKAYYDIIARGAKFLEFIHQDLECQGNTLNRDQRRRWKKELSKDGKFSREMIMYYQTKIDQILDHANKGLKK